MKNRFIIFLLFSFLLSSKKIVAQCAMCKAVVEANLESGGSIGAGLNDGILYLMAIPYISMIAIGFIWYRMRAEPKR
jgi:hypothetical protein|tara:strand:+ start:2044 stop:2274 length:231 start_codon:yes stop_codon:yes gene_type:complete